MDEPAEGHANATVGHELPPVLPPEEAVAEEWGDWDPDKTWTDAAEARDDQAVEEQPWPEEQAWWATGEPLPPARSEEVSVECHTHPLSRFQNGRAWTCWECGLRASDAGGPATRWSCLECGYDLCSECIERMPAQELLPKEGKPLRPWQLCSGSEAARVGLPLGVVVRGAQEAWLNQTLLLSAPTPLLADRGCYVYGAQSETAGQWAYMWWDSKSSKWKLASWQRGESKGPSIALCRAEDQFLTKGHTLDTWTVAKGPRADLPLTVTVLTDEELWHSQGLPLHLADVLGIVAAATTSILSELGEDEGAALDAPLMEMGMDSRRAFQLHEQLSEQLLMTLPPTLMFNAPTQRTIAKDIVEMTWR